MFVLLDGAVTLCILIEVVLTALVQRRTFLRLWSNRFDLFVLALCFAAIGMHALGTVNTEELELEELDVFVVVVRYVAQFARLALLLGERRAQLQRFIFKLGLLPPQSLGLAARGGWRALSVSRSRPPLPKTAVRRVAAISALEIFAAAQKRHN